MQPPSSVSKLQCMDVVLAIVGSLWSLTWQSHSDPNQTRPGGPRQDQADPTNSLSESPPKNSQQPSLTAPSPSLWIYQSYPLSLSLFLMHTHTKLPQPHVHFNAHTHFHPSSEMKAVWAVLCKGTEPKKRHKYTKFTHNMEFIAMWSVCVLMCCVIIISPL